MPTATTLISVRLDQETLDLLELAGAEYSEMRVDRRNQAYYPNYNRSQMIRHAIRTGLDVLTHQPALKL